MKKLLSKDKPYLMAIPSFQYDPTFCEKTAYQMLKERAAGHENIIALNFYGRAFTTAAFLERIDAAARAYSAMGICKDDNVSFFGLNTPELVESLYALNKIGAVSEWFNPNAMPAGLLRNHIKKNNVKALFIIDIMYPIVKEAIRDTNIAFVVVNSLMDSLPLAKKWAYYTKNAVLASLNNTLPKLCEKEKSLQKISFYRDKNRDSRFLTWKEMIQRGAGKAEVEESFDFKKTSIIVHTGGTTGPIKRIAMNDYAMNAAPYQISLMPNTFDAGDSLLQITPPMVAWSLESIHTAKFFNLTLNLIASYNRNEFARIVLSTRSNHYFTVPSFVKRIKEDAAFAGKDLSFIKTIFHGGEGIAVEDEKEIDRVLANGGAKARSALGFGQNEEFAGFFINLYIPGEEKVYGTCGVPLAGNDYIIYDNEKQEELPYGKDSNGNYSVGRLLVSGPSTMIGYIGDDEYLNKTTIIYIEEKKYIDTGDLAYADEKGRMFYCTREQRIIRTQQGKIFANVIEHILNGLPEIEECCVVKMPDSQEVAKASCHIVLKESLFRQSQGELAQNCKKIVEYVEAKTQEMYTYYIPGSYQFRKERLPLTAFGKVDYKQLEMENQKIYEQDGVLNKIRFDFSFGVVEQTH